MTTSKRKSIIIIGGGTAGWISLAYLVATVDADITIIHSNEIDIMGVGESTTPTIKHVADVIGVTEDSWMKAGRATYKYGIEFLNFNQQDSRWFHTFDDLLPGQTFNRPMLEFGKSLFKKNVSSVEYFFQQQQNNVPGYNIDYFVKSQGGSEFLLKNALSPTTPQGENTFNRYPGYSYHINAFEFGNCLKAHTPKEKYTEIVDTVKDVELDETGVKSIILKDGTKLSADLYVDCSGFHRLLIKHFTEFKPYQGLINNAAVWGPVKEQSYRPSTLSIAQDNGWIWETPTWGQTGTGYVYSDDFINEEQAIEHLTNHWAKQGKKWEPLRSVKFTSGRMENIACKNVVSNGLGQSFIEPLEATAIMVTCVTVKNLSKMFNKHNGWNEKSSRILSQVMSSFLDDTMLFVEGHYTLSDRDDTEYWRSYNKTNIIERMSAHVEKKLEKEWVHHGETNLNGYNWASMLVGYNKPFVGNIPTITDDEIENYKFYTRQLIENYEWIYKNNMTIKQRLEQIHL